MLAVNGYYDGHNYITEGNIAVKPNQRVIITFLDEDFDENILSKKNCQESYNQDSQDPRIQAVNGIFGILSHDEAEEIRVNRMNFKERV